MDGPEGGETDAVATMMANRDPADLLDEMGEQVRAELPALPVPPPRCAAARWRQPA